MEMCCAALAAVVAVAINFGYLAAFSIRAVYLGNYTAYKVYETVRYDIIRLLQILEFGVFVVSVYQNRKGIKGKDIFSFYCGHLRDGQSKHLFIQKKMAVFLLCVVILLLAISLVVLGCTRIFRIDRSDIYLFILAVMVQVFKFFNLMTECIMWLFVIILVFGYMSAWDTHQIKKRSYTESPTANTLMYFQDYHKKGHETEAYRKALQGWFLLQYLVYLMYIYTDIIHIVRPYFSGNGHRSLIAIVHHALFIGYDLTGFVLSYMLALWMIEAHRNYYMEMSKNHLVMEDVLSKKIEKRTKVKPVEGEEEITLERKECGEQIALRLGGDGQISLQEITPDGEEQSAVEEITPLEGEEEVRVPVASEPTEEVREWEDPQVALEQVGEGKRTDDVMSEELKEYIAQVIAMKIEVCTDFDFCPQFLDVSVPLSSPGYSVSVLIALFALIASFVP